MKRMKVSELQKQTPRTLAIKVYQRELRIERQTAIIDYYKVRDASHIKTIKAQADCIEKLEKKVKEFHKIAQVMAMQESDARKELQNYKDGIK